MKTLWKKIAVGLVLVSLVGALTYSVKSAEAKTKYKTYRNKKYGFQFQYPRTWKLYSRDAWRKYEYGQGGSGGIGWPVIYLAGKDKQSLLNGNWIITIYLSDKPLTSKEIKVIKEFVHKYNKFNRVPSSYKIIKGKRYKKNKYKYILMSVKHIENYNNGCEYGYIACQKTPWRTIVKSFKPYR